MQIKKYIWLTSLVLIFFVSTGLLYYAWWLFHIERGNRTIREGDSQAGVMIYETAEAPFRRFPPLARVLRDDYQKLVFNHMGALYAMGKVDEVIEKLEKEAARVPFLHEAGEYSFWTGNFLMRRATESKDPKIMVKNLNAALSAYRRGLETQPDDWDLKYNYELLRRILSQKGHGTVNEEERVKSILKKMPPLFKPAREEIPPEERG